MAKFPVVRSTYRGDQRTDTIEWREFSGTETIEEIRAKHTPDEVNAILRERVDRLVDRLEEARRVLDAPEPNASLEDAQRFIDSIWRASDHGRGAYARAFLLDIVHRVSRNTHDVTIGAERVVMHMETAYPELAERLDMGEVAEVLAAWRRRGGGHLRRGEVGKWELVARMSNTIGLPMTGDSAKQAWIEAQRLFGKASSSKPNR